MMRSATVDRPRTIFHLARASVWNSSKKHARPYETPSFQEDGFIQACDDGYYLKNIAEKRHARHQGGDFVVIEIDTDHPSFTNEVVYIPQIDTEFASGVNDDEHEHPRIFGAVSPKVVVSEQFISKPSSNEEANSHSPHISPPPPTEPPPRQDRFLCCLPSNTSSSLLPSFITGNNSSSGSNQGFSSVSMFTTSNVMSSTNGEGGGDNWSGYDESIEVSKSFSSEAERQTDISRASQSSDDASFKSAQAY